ncbi:hypothetical protein SAY86_027060 [Trapa natans]|uniref:Uncharacterized protein n=1 Tax=Trapa natans TaxID=22666 RepID=A0AAN7KSF3_TRANT|nr:hypothetical protein SAY86_027060 [Trapa natans]
MGLTSWKTPNGVVDVNRWVAYEEILGTMVRERGLSIQFFGEEEGLLIPFGHRDLHTTSVPVTYIFILHQPRESTGRLQFLGKLDPECSRNCAAMLVWLEMWLYLQKSERIYSSGQSAARFQICLGVGWQLWQQQFWGCHPLLLGDIILPPTCSNCNVSWRGWNVVFI